MKQPAVTLMLRTASILWVIWGLVHTIAGALVLAKPATAGFQAIADAVPPELLENTYHAAAGRDLDLAWQQDRNMGHGDGRWSVGRRLLPVS